MIFFQNGEWLLERFSNEQSALFPQITLQLHYSKMYCGLAPAKNILHLYVKSSCVLGSDNPKWIFYLCEWSLGHRKIVPDEGLSQRLVAPWLLSMKSHEYSATSVPEISSMFLVLRITFLIVSTALNFASSTRVEDTWGKKDMLFFLHISLSC